MVDIALYQPEIPPNTGNIIRLCANFGARLHLIKPLGFALDNRKLRRAGLDYREWAQVQQYDSLGEFLSALTPTRLIAFTTKGNSLLHQFEFLNGDVLLFGPETRGLPLEILRSIPNDRWLRIPMRAESRSLNLSNAVAIACFEINRQLGFKTG